MGKRPRITDKEWQTIRIALNCAIEERDGLADAYGRAGPEAEQAQALVARFEALHRKLFERPSDRAAEIERFANTPSIPITDLWQTKKRT